LLREFSLWRNAFSTLYIGPFAQPVTGGESRNA
jgi:hypothetical protein